MTHQTAPVAARRGAAPSPTIATTIVIPTVGRKSLADLLARLRQLPGPRPERIIVVDDRPSGPPLALPADDQLIVLAGGGNGPAAARNIGWRAATTPWVSFLDDDVLPQPDWLLDLAEDLAAADAATAGIQGRVSVPLPAGRRPTDWERTTAGLATSRWITADMSYRRSALQRCGGFDERFRRAFREDADLALRILDDGAQLATGRRGVLHPPRPAGFWVSVRTQRGNADDRLMRKLHGAQWRTRAAAPPGRLRRHAVITAAATGSAAALLFGKTRLAAVAGALWFAGTAEFAAARILPGPRTATEVAKMVTTSAAIPVTATFWALVGFWRHRRVTRRGNLPDLVLFDRDGTLIRDVPYNGDPHLVAPMPGAATALQQLRAAKVRVGVVTNQSGIGRGAISTEQVAAVNARVTELLGPFDAWAVCPHEPGAGCSCRKPAPGMVLAVCEQLGVRPEKCVVIGDIESDLVAAHTAGAIGILVPTPVTRPEEIARAPRVAADLAAAVDALLRAGQ